NVSLPNLCPGQVERVEAARKLRQSGEQRGLREVEIPRAHAEVHARRGLDPVGAASVVDVVEVQLEDLVLRPARLELQCQERLVKLAHAEGVARIAEVETARELPGERRRA